MLIFYNHTCTLYSINYGMQLEVLRRPWVRFPAAALGYSSSWLGLYQHEWTNVMASIHISSTVMCSTVGMMLIPLRWWCMHATVTTLYQTSPAVKSAEQAISILKPMYMDSNTCT